MFPTLAESMRVADNRFKFNQLTGRFNTNWLGAEGQAQAMQPPPEAPMDPGQQRLNATTVNPLTGRREWKPAKFGGPMTGFSPTPGIPAAPASGDAPQWDAQPVSFNPGPPGPERNPRGGGADPFDPRSSFANGKYFAEGGEVDGPGGPKDDLIPAMLSDGEFIMPAEAVKFFGLDKLNKMKEKAKEGLMEMGGGMPDDEGRMTNDRGMMPLNMAAGGPVSKDWSQFQLPPDMMAPQPPAFDPYAPENIQGPPVPIPNPQSPTPNPQSPPTLEDMRFRGLAARAALDNASVSPSPGPPVSPSSFQAPWEKDALARAQRDAPIQPMLDAGMRRTDIRRFMQSPQGIASVKAEGLQQQQFAREDQRNAARDAQDAEDRRLRMAEFQQRGDYYKRQAAAGDRAAELQVKQYELDVLKNEQEEKRRNTTPELKAVPTPDGRGVVYYSGNQLASGVMPTGKEEASVLTREQMDALDVEVDRVVDGKISYKKRGGGNPVLRDVTQPGQIAPTTYQFNPQTRQWEPPAIAGAAPAAPAAQSPRARNAPMREFKTVEEASKAGLKPGDRVIVGGRAATWK